MPVSPKRQPWWSIVEQRIETGMSLVEAYDDERARDGRRVDRQPKTLYNLLQVSPEFQAVVDGARARYHRSLVNAIERVGANELEPIMAAFDHDLVAGAGQPLGVAVAEVRVAEQAEPFFDRALGGDHEAGRSVAGDDIRSGDSRRRPTGFRAGGNATLHDFDVGGHPRVQRARATRWPSPVCPFSNAYINVVGPVTDT